MVQGGYTDNPGPTFSDAQLKAIITPEANATYNNFHITDGMFDSYTTGGITYAWSKGTNWPA